RMPPRSAAPGYGRFENAPGLTSREMATMLTWLDGGMPQGDEADLPASLEPITGETPRDAADLRLDLPEQHVPALEELVIRRVTISTTLTADRLVSRVVVRPGVRAVLRGALVYLGPDEQSWVGAWLPWQQTFASPLSRGFRISNGSALNVALYYRGGEQPIVDRPAVELHFAENRQPLDTLWIDTTDASVGSSPSGAARTGRLTLPSRTTIWALHSMVRTATDSLEVRARRPDGSIEVLLWMPRVQDEWPNVLVLQEPMTFPAGSVLTVSTRARDSGGPTDRVMIAGWRETEANAPPARQPPP
ncbi:MAG: hypothetical protein ACRD2A_21070, partial [Vicinamibacterales bacterium]